MSSNLNNKSSTPSKRKTKRLKPAKRAIKFAGRITFWFMAKTAGLLRPWSVKMFGNALGSMMYAASKRYRLVALKNLRWAFPEKSEREIRSIAKQVFQSFTRGGFEFFHMLALSPEQIGQMIDLKGCEHIDAALAKGKGCILITAHYGNWELMARKASVIGYKVNVIARDSDDPGMTGIATRIRENSGYKVFDRDEPMIGVFRALRNNECLGILPDQNDLRGIFVKFFGKLCATATGPAVLALRSGAALVPVFSVRGDDGRYTATAYPAIEFTPSGDEEKDIADLTALIQLAIERQVRECPEQWLWLHDRWKMTPEAPKIEA